MSNRWLIISIASAGIALAAGISLVSLLKESKEKSSDIGDIPENTLQSENRTESVPEQNNNQLNESTPEIPEPIQTGKEPLIEEIVQDDSRNKRTGKNKKTGQGPPIKEEETTQATGSEKTESIKREFVRKPEIICWEEGREFHLGIDVPDEMFENDDFMIKQGDSELDEFESESGIFQITNLRNPIIYGNNETLSFFSKDDKYLIFKLSDSYSGRRVKKVSSGQYLVAVPEGWLINENCCDSVIVPEVTNFSIDNYKALIIEISKSSGVIEFTTENESVTLPSSLHQFKLSGDEINTIADKSPLFASPPELHSMKSDDSRDDVSWDNVSWINLVEEGKIGDNRWHKEVPKTPVNNVVPLKDILSESPGGWFSARLYDNDNDLIETLTFRYMTGLKSIDIQLDSIFPCEKPIRINIHHEDNVQCNVNAPADVKSKFIHYGSTISLPMDFQEESVKLSFSKEKTKTINVKIPIEQIWWAKGNESSKSSEWNKDAITLDRNDFNNLNNGFWIKLPWKGWKGSISMKLDEGSTISYKPTKSDDCIFIPIKDFVDKVMNAEIGLHSLNLIAQPDNSKKQDTAKIASFTVYAGCIHCDNKCNNVEHLLKHIENDCLDKYFPQLTYDEYKKRFPELPNTIYVCSYCGAFVRADHRYEKPTDAIYEHQQKHCEKVLKILGDPQIRYWIITDMDEIREKVMKNMPKIVKCELCGEEFENPDEKTLISHLTEHHSSDFYKKC